MAQLEIGDEVRCKIDCKRHDLHLGEIYTVDLFHHSQNTIMLRELPNLWWDKQRFVKEKKIMTYTEAMEAIREGEKVRPTSWAKNAYIKNDKGRIITATGHPFNLLMWHLRSNWMKHESVVWHDCNWWDVTKHLANGKLVKRNGLEYKMMNDGLIHQRYEGRGAGKWEPCKFCLANIKKVHWKVRIDD